VGVGGEKDLFSWLLKQPQEEVLDLLALCVSSSVNTVTSREDAPVPEVLRLMTALDMNMANWWGSTADNYLSHVSKDGLSASCRMGFPFK
jgi:ParB family transcriptional regulator, chromosome partitioning protein